MTSKSSRRESSLRLPDWQQAIYQRCVYPAGTPIPWHASDEDGSLADRFEKVARLVPDRLAVQSEDGSLTYRELNEAANRIGHAIVALQSDVGVPIALLCSKGVGICVSAFATLKAGHFLTALDPTYARNQLDHIVRDSQTNVILTDSQNYQLANELVGGRAHVLDIESIGLGGPIDSMSGSRKGGTRLASSCTRQALRVHQKDWSIATGSTCTLRSSTSTTSAVKIESHCSTLFRRLLR